MAGVHLTLRTDVRRAVAEVRGLRADIKDKATYRALNRALDRVATESGREIRKEYNVKLSAVKRALRKHRANRSKLTSRLVVEGVRLGLIEFAARAVNPWNVKGRRHRPGGGVSVQVKVQGGRKLVRGAFITAATANNARGGGSMGMKQVFRRRGRARDSMLSLRSVSIPQAFINPAVVRAVEAIAVIEFHKNFEQQVRFLSGRV